jgi:hypothetical protein
MTFPTNWLQEELMIWQYPDRLTGTHVEAPRSEAIKSNRETGYALSPIQLRKHVRSPQPSLLCCVSMLASFAACHDRFNTARIPGSPVAKGSQRLPQSSPESREGIFDLRRYLSEIDTIDYPVRLQLLEVLNQHFVTNLADCAS